MLGLSQVLKGGILRVATGLRPMPEPASQATRRAGQRALVEAPFWAWHRDQRRPDETFDDRREPRNLRRARIPFSTVRRIAIPLVAGPACSGFRSSLVADPGLGATATWSPALKLAEDG